jgi:hypothetical protein
MAQVQPATVDMFDDIYPLLAELNAALPREKWRQLVDYPWRRDGDGIGYVLVHDGSIVGFLSTLHSRRIVDGKEVRFCNTAHWIVRKEHRGDSFRLLLAALRDPDSTITNLTSSPAVSELMQKLGFKLLEQTLQVFIPMPRLPFRGNGAVLETDASAIAAALRGADRTIFADHETCSGHLLVREGDAYCYIVYSRNHRRMFGINVPYCHIQYVSNREIFRRQLARIRWCFLRRCGAWFVAADERFVGRDLGVFSRPHRLAAPRYYRSRTLAPHQVDNLYTELALGL